ncbi:MAG: D-alanyl-D-alanine carboxypeptidase [Pseudomonadota bacterium]
MSLVAITVALLIAAASPADARKTASLVIDANTGKTLHASNADAPRYPASLTKMMTLYMVFDAIERGKLTYKTRMRTSSTAASRPPSKLGLKPGDTISVRAAVAALVAKSANDVAAVVAEHLSGSEEAFARAMTRKARAIGMRRTTFRNASGLPNRRQVTTARDMVRLGLRLQDDFPKHYGNFRRTHLKWRGKTYRTTNTLVRSLRGTDGIKTGYTRASGFNLVSSIKRGRRHVVAAVFGGKTARGRNNRMRVLLSRGLAKASTRKTRKRRPTKPLLVAKPKLRVPPPRLIARPRSTPTVRRAATRRTTTNRIAVASVRRVPLTGQRTRSQARPLRTASLSTRPPRSISDILAGLIRPPKLARRPSTLNAQAAALGVRAQPARFRGTVSNIQIQVGAYRTRREALQRLNDVRTRGGGVLVSSEPIAMPVSSGSRRLYRARFAGFQNRTTALATCTRLRQRGIDCHVAR